MTFNPVGEIEQIDVDEDGQPSAWIRLSENVELGQQVYIFDKQQDKSLINKHQVVAWGVVRHGTMVDTTHDKERAEQLMDLGEELVPLTIR